jgi:hypothetical protein
LEYRFVVRPFSNLRHSLLPQLPSAS